jgi:hypothetical protein
MVSYRIPNLVPKINENHHRKRGYLNIIAVIALMIATVDAFVLGLIKTFKAIQAIIATGGRAR